MRTCTTATVSTHRVGDASTRRPARLRVELRAGHLRLGPCKRVIFVRDGSRRRNGSDDGDGLAKFRCAFTASATWACFTANLSSPALAGFRSSRRVDDPTRETEPAHWIQLVNTAPALVGPTLHSPLRAAAVFLQAGPAHRLPLQPEQLRAVRALLCHSTHSGSVHWLDSGQ